MEVRNLVRPTNSNIVAVSFVTESSEEFKCAMAPSEAWLSESTDADDFFNELDGEIEHEDFYSSTQNIPNFDYPAFAFNLRKSDDSVERWIVWYIPAN